MEEHIANKLIRDNIPEIIKSKGNTCEFITLEKKEFLQALKEKLVEESKEVLESNSREKTIEELADVLEVFYTYIEEENISILEIEENRRLKKDKNGTFKKKLFLKTYTK